MSIAFIRNFRSADRQGVRSIYGDDEFARPLLLRRYPRMSEYLADEASVYYTDYEPESLFVAETDGMVVGALLGAVKTDQHEHYYRTRIRSLLLRRCLSGAYGLPVWYLPVMLTEYANRQLKTPVLDRSSYPAHLHIGVLPGWRRQGIGSALMGAFSGYLESKGIPGFHLYTSSFHPLGLAFYRKLGLEDLGFFTWRFHDGCRWSTITEYIFGKKIG